jgi:hypothetical protein
MVSNRIIVHVANLSHEYFRQLYREKNNGTRIKTTKDKKWIEKNGTDQADLAKLKYSDLPVDWQSERRSGAKVAIETLQEWIETGKPIDYKFIEFASNIVHEDWLSRNLKRAEEEHKLTYSKLSEDAKEKDRIFVRAAVKVFLRRKL